MKRTLTTSGLIALGVLAALGVYVGCVAASFLAGGWVHSIAHGARVAPVITIAIVIYCWTRRRATAPWPMIVTMLSVQLVMAALALVDIS